MTTRLCLGVLSLTLLGACLVGCRTPRITPYAFKPSEEDPRLLIRVPEGTPGSETVPKRERLHRRCWARRCGEEEVPDERWSCCPEGEESEERKRNEVALFLGYTGVRAGDGSTVGLTYARVLRRNFGVLAFGEYVSGHEQVPVFGAGIFFRPNNRATVLFALGAELEEHDTAGLLRFGATYMIVEAGGLRFSPAIYADLIENKDPVFLLGIEIGREF